MVFFKGRCCLMSMNLSPSLASHIVIVSLPVILENNGIAALMENQSHPEHLCTSSFFFFLLYLFLPVHCFGGFSTEVFNSHHAH